MQNQNTLPAKIALDAFNLQLGRASKLVEGLTDEQLAAEVSPGRNSGTYLLGHLTAVHDAMLPLLGFGDRMHPELEEPFLKNPDKSGLAKPAATQLREYWHKVNNVLTSKLQTLTPEQWFERHNSVTEEEFKTEPHRNKLNIVLGRTNHLTYHLGQMAFLKK